MKILLRIYRTAKPFWAYIIIGTISLFLLTAVNLWTPRLIQNMVAVLENADDYADPIRAIVMIALTLLFAYALQAVFRFINNYYSHVGAWNFVSDIRVHVYEHLQRMSLSYYHDKQTGQLMSRIVNDTNAFESLIAHAIPELVGAVILFVGVTVILFTMNVTLALLTCIPIPFIFFTAPVMKRIRAQHKQAQIHIAELNGTLQDNLSGIREIQAFNKEEPEREKVEGYSKMHIAALLKALLYSAIFHPSLNFLTSLGNVIVVGFGGYIALTTKTLTISELVGFFMYLSMFYGPVSTFARITEDMQAGIVGGERIFEILDTASDVIERPDARAVPILSGEVTFDHVSFEYQDGQPILSDITFTVPAKKMYALVGATGVGKTTLTALMPRFYDPQSGAIRIDGIDIRDMTLSSLRGNISMVLQDVFLFNGSLRENILYGAPNATEDDLISAAKMACVHDFITSLPEGFDTVVGERGMRLSGGQKQRISIARAILSQSSILILDEATSAVDTETEREIQDAIAQIAGSRTMLVIAHRLSTVKKADCIIVLNEGRVAERGTHAELIAKGGIYSRLIEMQG